MVSIPPSPRKVRLSERGRQFRNGTLFFIIPSLLAILWLAIDIPRQLLHREELRHGRVETTARIEKFGRFGRSSELWVKYTFEVQGRSFGSEVTAPESFEASLSQSNHVLVRYLASDPTNNYPAAWEWSVLSEVGWLVPMVWGIPGLLLVNTLRGQRKLAVEGVAIFGTVTSCSPIKSGFEITYDFRGPDGLKTKGSGWSLDSLQTGSRIDVLFLPRNPLESLPYPLKNYEILNGLSQS